MLKKKVFRMNVLDKRKSVLDKRKSALDKRKVF